MTPFVAGVKEFAYTLDQVTLLLPRALTGKKLGKKTVSPTQVLVLCGLAVVGSGIAKEHKESNKNLPKSPSHNYETITILYSSADPIQQEP